MMTAMGMMVTATLSSSLFQNWPATRKGKWGEKRRGRTADWLSLICVFLKQDFFTCNFAFPHDFRWEENGQLGSNRNDLISIRTELKSNRVITETFRFRFGKWWNSKSSCTANRDTTPCLQIGGVGALCAGIIQQIAGDMRLLGRTLVKGTLRAFACRSWAIDAKKTACLIVSRAST